MVIRRKREEGGLVGDAAQFRWTTELRLKDVSNPEWWPTKEILPPRPEMSAITWQTSTNPGTALCLNQRTRAA